MKTHYLCSFLIYYEIALASLPITMAVDKDGFNYYKDYLRGKNDEIEDLGEPIREKLLYFYRTPVQLGVSGNRPLLDVEFGKRTANKFKNYMLGKDSTLEDADDARPKKSGKTMMAWIMTNKLRFGDGANKLPEDAAVAENHIQ